MTKIFATLLLIWLPFLPSAANAQRARSHEVQARKPVHAVKIRFGIVSGMCVGYCSWQLEVTPGEATLLVSSFYDKQRYRDWRVRADISDKRWRELQQLADHDTLVALPDRVGCPGCVDQPLGGITVTFSDKTTKSIDYNFDSSAKVIAGSETLALLNAKLYELQEKLRNEIPLVR